jgi:hypothetical protein
MLGIRPLAKPFSGWHSHWTFFVSATTALPVRRLAHRVAPTLGIGAPGIDNSALVRLTCDICRV